MATFMAFYPIPMIVIGAKNMDKCTIEPKIPIWLIVFGSVSIFLAILYFIGIVFLSKM